LPAPQPAAAAAAAAVEEQPAATEGYAAFDTSLPAHAHDYNAYASFDSEASAPPVPLPVVAPPAAAAEDLHSGYSAFPAAPASDGGYTGFDSQAPASQVAVAPPSESGYVVFAGDSDIPAAPVSAPAPPPPTGTVSLDSGSVPRPPPSAQLDTTLTVPLPASDDPIAPASAGIAALSLAEQASPSDGGDAEAPAPATYHPSLFSLATPAPAIDDQWNERFQAIMERPIFTVDETLARGRELRVLFGTG
jgi:hypothetical protein